MMCRRTVWAVTGLALWVAGCSNGPALRCKYQLGQTDRIKITLTQFYKNWVEMPDRPNENGRSRETRDEIVLRRHVDEVKPDGSAVMTVTMEQVQHVVEVIFPDKHTTQSYLSTADKTESSWPDEAMLGGRTYRVLIGPDTTVRQFLDRDELLRKLGLGSGDRGVAATLVSENFLKACHERDFVQYGGAAGGTTSHDFSLPNEMIKAQAIRKTYATGPVQANGHQTLAVAVTGAPLHELPQGLATPMPPNDSIQRIIKDASDMEEFVWTGQGVLDVTAGTVQKEEQQFRILLILQGENVPFLQGKTKPGQGGLMFTEIKQTRLIERLP
jgi:hypothetical protein